MKRITFSADERLIEAARKRAEEEQTTVNEQFRLWLEEYAGGRTRSERAMETIRELQGRITSRGPYTRDQMNER